jgi:hypothetical protein
MMARATLALALLALGAAGPAAAAEAQQSARAEVGKPVQEAQALLRAKKFAEALAALRKADAVPDKNPYETYIVDEVRAGAEIGAGDYAAAAAALEGVIGTHILPPADEQQRLATLVRLEYQLKDYAKTVAAGARYYKDGGGDPEPRRLMAQAYFFENDFADAAKTIRALLDEEARAGTPADEQLLLALAGSDLKLKDEGGYIDALTRLAAAYPKHQYWVDLCRAVGQRESFAPRLKLDLDRVAMAAGAFDQPQQYAAAAELALQQGFPGDAKSFLDQGFAAGVLGRGATADREKRLQAMAQSQAADDQKSLAQQAQEASAAKDGEKLEKLGEADASYGRRKDAAAALEQSLARGLAHPDDAKLHLGMAYLKDGDARAKPLLQSVKGGDGTGDLARLWLALGPGH